MKKASSSWPKETKKKLRAVRKFCLLHHTKSEVDNLIKPQREKSKTVVPTSYVEDSVNAEFIPPTTSFSPEEILLVNIDLKIYDEETSVSASNENNELTA